MLKRMWKMTGRLVDLITGRQFLAVAGLALVSNSLAYASTSTTGLPWETPLQTVQQSLTGPVAAGISVVGIAAGGMALVFGGELSEFAKRACYAVIATGAIVGAGKLMTTLFSTSSVVIAMTGASKMRGPSETVFHPSINRPNLLMGGDRELVLGAAMIFALFIFSLMTWRSILIGLVFWPAATSMLARLARVDPMMRDVASQSLQYKAYYPAKSRLSSRSQTQRRTWR